MPNLCLELGTQAPGVFCLIAQPGKCVEASVQSTLQRDLWIVVFTYTHWAGQLTRDVAGLRNLHWACLFPCLSFVLGRKTWSPIDVHPARKKFSGLYLAIWAIVSFIGWHIYLHMYLFLTSYQKSWLGSTSVGSFWTPLKQRCLLISFMNLKFNIFKISVATICLVIY
jgi:hypothetical protein